MAPEGTFRFVGSLLLLSICAGVTGLGAAVLVLTTFTGWPPKMPLIVRPVIFYAAVVIASLISGVLCWWQALRLPARLTVRHGIGLGVLSSAIAHPLTWYDTLLFVYLFANSANSNNPDPLESIIWSLFFSAWSLVFAGWLTAVIGGAIGGLIAWVARRYLSGD